MRTARNITLRLCVVALFMTTFVVVAQAQSPSVIYGLPVTDQSYTQPTYHLFAKTSVCWAVIGLDQNGRLLLARYGYLGEGQTRRGIPFDVMPAWNRFSETIFFFYDAVGTTCGNPTTGNLITDPNSVPVVFVTISQGLRGVIPLIPYPALNAPVNIEFYTYGAGSASHTQIYGGLERLYAEGMPAAQWSRISSSLAGCDAFDMGGGNTQLVCK